MLGRRRALFNPRFSPFRPMVLIVDSELLSSASGDPRLRYLLELAAHAPVEAHLYAFDGTQPTVAPSTAVDTGTVAYREWVVVRPQSDRRRHEAAFFRDGVPQVSPMLTDDSVFRQIAAKGQVMEEEATALLVAKSLRADILVTQRSFSVDSDSGYWRNTLVLSPNDTLPIVGLYLRCHDHYLIGQTPSLGAPRSPAQSNKRDRSTFFWEAAQALLPFEATWSFALRAHASETGNRALADLSRSIIWRFDQVLRSRDRMLVLLAVVPQEHAPVDDILIEVDQILLFLMATLDITARITHAALTLPGRPRDAGWQNEKWLESVEKKDEAIAAIFAEGTPGRQVLDILRLLRNTIHAVAFSAHGMIPVVGDQAMQPLVPLPLAIRDKLLSAFNAHGNSQTWGVVQPFPDAEYHLRPGDFVEQLMHSVTSLLNEVMLTVTAERLAGAASGRLPGPTPRGHAEMRTLWQLGFNLAE